MWPRATIDPRLSGPWDPKVLFCERPCAEGLSLDSRCWSSDRARAGCGKHEGPQILSNLRATSDAGPVSRILYGVAAAMVIPLGRPSLAGSSDLPGSWSVSSRSAFTVLPPEFLPYLVLLRVGFALPRASLLGRCALTAPFHPYPGNAGAVCFLWHFPSNGFMPTLPDVIRHTALRSSDFPLSWPRSPGNPGVSRPDSDHPARHQLSIL